VTAKQSFVPLINDQPKEIRSVAELLRTGNMRVNLATDAPQGRQHAQALRPGLILLGMRMPDTDGFAACRIRS